MMMMIDDDGMMVLGLTLSYIHDHHISVRRKSAAAIEASQATQRPGRGGHDEDDDASKPTWIGGCKRFGVKSFH